MDSVQVLKDYKLKAEARMSSFFDEKIKASQEFGPHPKQLLQDLKEYTLRGGKRIRSTMAVYGFKCLKEENEAILDAGVSLEFIHAFLLIHDDIMDEDLLRRGGQTFHATYLEKARKEFPKARAQRFGENVGIIAGDLLQSFGFEALTKADFEEGVKKKALEKLNDIVSLTAFGQLLDLLNEVRDKVTEEDVLMVHQLKTAHYTIAGPLQLGAILAGASERELRDLNEYGIHLGKAFQIQDDILGLFGSEEKFGKPTDSDLKEGKRTLLILKALEKGSDEDRKKIEQALGNQELAQEQADEVREIIKKTGSLMYSQKMAKTLIVMAKQAITRAEFREEAKEFLLGIADYMLHREH